MELTKDFISEHKLEDGVVKAFNELSNSSIAEAKKEFEGVANQNAEAILTGASKKIFKDTKIERQQGEKMGDYIGRAWSESNVNKIKELGDSKSDYEDKLKNFKGNDDLITKIKTLEEKEDGLLKKFADYDNVKEKAELYQPLLDKYESNKKEVAFNSVKPNFPNEVNSYEAQAKWTEFRDNILDKWDLEIVDGKAMAISKENKHKQESLSLLVERDETIKSLLLGRQQNGVNGKEANLTDVKDVPFRIPEKLDSEERTKLIQEHLVSKGLSPISSEYSVAFAKINKAILHK